MTIPRKTRPLGCLKMNDKLNQRGYMHEIQAAQHRTDQRHPERGKIRPCGQATLPQVWHQRLTKLVVDQAIEIQLFKDITSKTRCKTGQESVIQRAPRHGNDASEKSPRTSRRTCPA